MEKFYVTSDLAADIRQRISLSSQSPPSASLQLYCIVLSGGSGGGGDNDNDDSFDIRIVSQRFYYY